VNKTVLIFESDLQELARLKDLVEDLGYNALATARASAATEWVVEEAPIAAITNDSVAGLEISAYIRDLAELTVPLGVLVDQDPAEADEILIDLDADCYFERPASVEGIKSFLLCATRIASLRQEVFQQAASLARVEEKLEKLAVTSSRSGFHLFEQVKDLLVVEVRRSKRYGYPLAILMVGLDPPPAVHEMQRPDMPREVTSGLAAAIAKSIRDIDIPIHYADDRILVFLPHTDLRGAEEVGRRVKRRCKRITYRADGITAQLTASVGVAGVSGGDKLTFSRLIKYAAAALRAAQLKGGDKVMKRLPAKPKAPKDA
jgi:diguanylate cyclase (GGDEF)-like protein